MSWESKLLPIRLEGLNQLVRKVVDAREMMSSGSRLLLFLHIVLFGLAHYTALAGLGVLSYVVGRKITRNVQYHSTWEGAAVCTSLGLGVIAYLVFALCLAHWLYPAALLGVLGVTTLVCAPELRSLAGSLSTSLRRCRLTSLLGVGLGALILLVPYALLGLYPPQAETSFDALMYHLVVAKLYVQHHGFVFAPYVVNFLFPEHTELLFTAMLTLFDDITAQLVSTLVLAVLLVAVFAWGERFFSRTAGYWAAAILLGIPMVVWLGTTAYIDITLTLFGTLALYSCWNWLHDHAQHWLILAAAFAGFAAATKYLGLFLVGAIGLIVLFNALRGRRYIGALLFLVVAAASAAPWYARTMYYTGNPVFPFLSRIFGHGYWTADEVAAVVKYTQAVGVGRSVSAFVSLPWQLAFHPAVFESTAGLVPKKFFLLIPLVIPFAFLDRRFAFVCALAFAYVIFWFLTTQNMRYLLLSLPLMSLGLSAALYSVLDWRLWRRWTRNGFIFGIVFAALTYVGWLSAVNDLRAYGPVPVTEEQRDAYLARLMPAYSAVKFLNSRNKGRQYTVFPIQGGTDTLAYYTDGRFIGEQGFGVAHSASTFFDSGDNKNFYRALRSLGADYVLRVRGRHVGPGDAFFAGYFRLIYSRGPVELYEIVPAAQSTASPSELGRSAPAPSGP